MNRRNFIKTTATAAPALSLPLLKGIPTNHNSLVRKLLFMVEILIGALSNMLLY